MTRFLLYLGAILTLVTALRFGFVPAVGFAAGVVVAWLNFRSLHIAVNALAERVVASQHPENGFALVLGFFFRYLLAGAVGYVIFTSSSQAFRGFLFGLCSPVGAMLLEAAVEAYSAIRRGY
jgi:hypothetical protein